MARGSDISGLKLFGRLINWLGIPKFMSKIFSSSILSATISAQVIDVWRSCSLLIMFFIE